jgi:hypothetical protein
LVEAASGGEATVVAPATSPLTGGASVPRKTLAAASIAEPNLVGGRPRARRSLHRGEPADRDRGESHRRPHVPGQDQDNDASQHGEEYDQEEVEIR